MLKENNCHLGSCTQWNYPLKLKVKRQAKPRKFSASKATLKGTLKGVIQREGKLFPVGIQKCRKEWKTHRKSK